MPSQYPQWTAESVRAIVASHLDLRGPLLPVLHAIQQEYGYIPSEAIALVAEGLNLSRAEVYGVLTFYKDFRLEPPAAVRITACRGEACQAAGAQPLAQHIGRRLGLHYGGATPDRSISFDEVFCLGNCALGPAIVLGERLLGRVSAEVFDEALAEAVAVGGGPAGGEAGPHR